MEKNSFNENMNQCSDTIVNKLKVAEKEYEEKRTHTDKDV